MKNRSLFSGIADRIHQAGQEKEAVAVATVDERTTPFNANISSITNPRAPGQPAAPIQKISMQRMFWVDPARCRLWQHHNRAYALLNAERCEDLIGGFRALGRQERPAIVRTLKGEDRQGPNGEEYDYEILSGARRHWTVSWLREHGETNSNGEPYFFLVVVRDELDTQSAFELSDAENRGQQDISDYERAREYRWALDALYEGNISRMAEAIHIDRSNLSRILALHEMPEDVVRAFPSILEIRVSHWRQLGPFFTKTDQQDVAERILSCARSVARARMEHSQNVPATGADTVAVLLDAAKERRPVENRSMVLATVSAKTTGKMAMRVKRTTRGMTLELPRSSGASKEELVAAFHQVIDDYYD